MIYLLTQTQAILLDGNFEIVSDVSGKYCLWLNGKVNLCSSSKELDLKVVMIAILARMGEKDLSKVTLLSYSEILSSVWTNLSDTFFTNI